VIGEPWDLFASREEKGPLQLQTGKPKSNFEEASKEKEFKQEKFRQLFTGR
jgi:hypothetical protein